MADVRPGERKTNAVYLEIGDEVRYGDGYVAVANVYKDDGGTWVVYENGNEGYEDGIVFVRD